MRFRCFRWIKFSCWILSGFWSWSYARAELAKSNKWGKFFTYLIRKLLLVSTNNSKMFNTYRERRYMRYIHILYIRQDANIGNIRWKITQSIFRKAVRAAIFLLPLMGIANILFLVDYRIFKKAWKFALWSYVTYFITTFQGFFVAVLYCFLNEEVNHISE